MSDPTAQAVREAAWAVVNGSTPNDETGFSEVKTDLIEDLKTKLMLDTTAPPPEADPGDGSTDPDVNG